MSPESIKSIEPTKSADRAVASAPLADGSRALPPREEEKKAKEGATEISEEERKQVSGRLKDFVVAMKAKTGETKPPWLGGKQSAASPPPPVPDPLDIPDFLVRKKESKSH